MAIFSEMRSMRQAAVAGQFYPSDPDDLFRMVDGFLNDAKPMTGRAKAIIGPHAGYVFSGPIAGSAYRAFDGLDPNSVTRVILLGPAHRVSFRGVAACAFTHFSTPMGDVIVEPGAMDRVLNIPGVIEYDGSHTGEHSLEVHLPFIQRVFPRARIIPLLVGHDAENTVESILEAFWGGPETRIVISSDLSHFYAYDVAKVMDQNTSQAIVELDPDGVISDGACGAVPVRGLLRVARKKRIHAKILDLRSSGDTAGSQDQVVGYGAYAFYEETS
jgi:AmmeMemoRadiSam system protein B